MSAEICVRQLEHLNLLDFVTKSFLFGFRELVSLEIQVGSLSDELLGIIGRNSIEFGTLSFLSLGDRLESLLFRCVISEQVIIGIFNFDSGNVIDKGQDGKRKNELVHFYVYNNYLYFSHFNELQNQI